MTAIAVDVSHHDWDRVGGRMDWAAAARSGVVAACVRATYGDPDGVHYATRHAREMIRGAAAAGLITGAYHNLVRGDAASVRRQVDWLRREIDAAGATWAMVDVERYPELLEIGAHPRIADARAWCDRWRAVDSRPLLVYLPRWVWQHMGSPDLRGLGVGLVASDYGPNGAGPPAELYAGRGGDSGRGWQPYGGVTPVLWQYGSRAHVPGLSSQTDINAYRGSPSELRALLTGEDEDMPLTTDDIRKIWSQDGTVQAYPPSDTNPTWAAGTALYWANRRAAEAVTTAQAAQASAEASRAVVVQLAEAIRAGGGSVDTAAILAGVDERLARLPTADAIADAVVAEIAS